jgi:hypothetical protein
MDYYQANKLPPNASNATILMAKAYAMVHGPVHNVNKTVPMCLVQKWLWLMNRKSPSPS